MDQESNLSPSIYESEELRKGILQNSRHRINLDVQHEKLIDFFIRNKIYSYSIVEAPSNYYDYQLHERQSILRAHSIDVLCKTIILENVLFDPQYESEFYKRYYLCIVQYTNEFHAEKIAKFLKNRHNSNCKVQLANKNFKFRLCKEEQAYEMSGYRFNCITPFLMKDENLGILLPDTLLNIYPQYFWVGGGEIELKIGISIIDFLKLYGDRTLIGEFNGK